MAKVLIGTVVSTKMTDTVVVEVVRRTPHPLYKKLMKRSQKFKASPNGHDVSVGDSVRMVEGKKVAKGKYFTVDTILSIKTEAPKSVKKAKAVETVEEPKEVKETKITKKASAKPASSKKATTKVKKGANKA